MEKTRVFSYVLLSFVVHVAIYIVLYTHVGKAVHSSFHHPTDKQQKYKQETTAQGIQKYRKTRNRTTEEEEVFTGNAVDWVLKKVDESLDDVEENPPPYAKAIYEISTGPVGEAASKGAATAAKVTVQVGAQALKAAAPLGKWVLTQGFKAAVGVMASGVSSALNSSSRSNGKKKKSRHADGKDDTGGTK